MKFITTLVCLSGVFLSGCSMLPTAGPTRGEVMDQAKPENSPSFTLVNVNNAIVDRLLAYRPESLHSRFGRYGIPPESKVSIGDTVAVTIWEAGGGSLFGNQQSSSSFGSQQSTLQSGVGSGQSSTASPSSTIPAQVVSRDGAISVPFAGRIQVAGRTVFKVQQEIEERLKGKATDPQVIVSVTTSAFNSATLAGDAVNGARVLLSPKGDRILDLIASAGGVRVPLYNVFVKLSRDGVTAAIPLEALISDPAENIYVWPGDVLTIVNTPQSFDALGAIGSNSDIPFGAEKLTLSQALGKASGLDDNRADPAGVFLFRAEPATLVAELQPDAPKVATQTGLVPVLYQLDFKSVNAFFLAQQFPVKDKDLIFVANAKLTGVQKLFSLVGTLASPITTGAVVQNAAK